MLFGTESPGLQEHLGVISKGQMEQGASKRRFKTSTPIYFTVLSRSCSVFCYIHICTVYLFRFLKFCMNANYSKTNFFYKVQFDSE
jgi:hypothetical protein